MINYETFDFAKEAALALKYAQKNAPEEFKNRYVRAIWLDHEEEIWNVNGTGSKRFTVSRKQLLGLQPGKDEISWEV